MPPTDRVATALGQLRARASEATRTGMARYAIGAEHAWGVTVADIRVIAKGLGRDHALALGLWGTGIYEAQLLAAFVDDPKAVSVEQMDRWIAETDNWASCDTVCFHLFDRTPHAFGRVHAWAPRDEEFVRRGAFALLAALAGHDRQAPDAAFLTCLPLVERYAADERNFVKKGVSWALRGVGRRSGAVHAECLALAGRLAESTSRAARWVGRDALRELGSEKVRALVARRAG